MEIKGKVHEVSPTTQVTDTFKKRELIVEYVENPQYPEYIKFEAGQDRCALLDNVKVGDDVEVFFNLRGRPWKDKTGKTSYFNSLNLWKINVLSGASNNASTPAYAAPTADISSGADDDDDLPF
jgi:hypothetical protein